MKNLNELIPIEENNGQKAVNARYLHAFLESKQQFADWMKNRIRQYDFMEGQDYQMLYLDYQGNLLYIRDHNFMMSDSQRVSKIEYALSINMAKELAMIENNEKGKQARKYFIACQEAATEKKQLSRKELALMVVQAEEEKERLQLENKGLQQQIEEQRPAVVFTESVRVMSTNILIRDLAKIITQNGYKIGEQRLYEWMVKNIYLIRNKRWSKTRNRYMFYYTPTQAAAERKLFWVSERSVSNPGQQPFASVTCYVTGEGQIFFINKFKNLNVA